MSHLSIVVAIARNGVIGLNGKLPWNIPEDMRHFRQVTTGHAVIMGRKTFESIGKPLPNRTNIVVSEFLLWRHGEKHDEDAVDLLRRKDGVVYVPSLAAALDWAGDAECMAIGGAGIYREALPIASRIYLTEIDRDVEGDTFFRFDRSPFREVERRAGEDPTVQFVTLERVP